MPKIKKSVKRRFFESFYLDHSAAASLRIEDLVGLLTGKRKSPVNREKCAVSQEIDFTPASVSDQIRDLHNLYV